MVGEPGIYRVARRLHWGECDPAGIIYTPAGIDIATKTLETWFGDVIGLTWFEMNTEMGMGMPTVRAEIDYVGALAVDREFICDLHVEQLGRASLTVRVTAHDGAGKTFFNAAIVSCLIEKPAFKAKPWPDDIRARIEAYRAACGDA